ncbi:hypothetical protein PSACC_02258, partial [Paramicrosporidium saccamoebae]
GSTVHPASSHRSREERQVENVLVEQSALSMGEVQSVVDLHVPIIGLLLGDTSDNGVVFIRSLHRIERETNANGYSVDHGAILDMLANVACYKPVVLRMQRILCGSVKEDVEAGIRFDFYAHRKGLELAMVPHRIIETAFVSPLSLSSCLHDQMTDFAEAAAQRKCLSRWDLDYDMMLSRLIRANEQAATRLLWNARSRLVMDKFHLRRMIRQRMGAVENLWPLKSVDSDAELYADNTQRIATLIHQMVTKELPYAITDSAKKAPSCATLNYERPTIAMKTARGSSSSGSTKKRKTAGKTAAKVPPRPILPAVRSRTPSSESINAEQSEAAICDPLLPLATVCEDPNSTLENVSIQTTL